MPPSLDRRTPHPCRWPRSAHWLPASARPNVPKVCPLAKLATFSDLKVLPPSGPVPRPVLRQMLKRCRLQESPSALPPLPHTTSPAPPASHLSFLPAPGRKVPQPICSQTLAKVKSFRVAGNNPPPSRSLFSAPARRSRSPREPRRNVAPPASPSHTRGALAFARNPSG